MILDTLLVPTDGSEPAVAAAQRAFELAVELDATVHILSVADSSIATGAGYSGDSTSIREQLRQTATDRATSLRDTASEYGLDATAVVREGIPAQEIVAYADDHAVDAITIGTSGRGGVTRAIIGSVADKVVRTSPVPVVTVTPAAARAETGVSGVDSMLVPTDGSDPATVAIEHALLVAAQLEATVHLLSVRNAGLEASLSAATADDAASHPQPREHIVEHLQTLAADAEANNLATTTAITDGSPAREIIAYADENDVDMIAMGTHGRGGFERAVVGSVTDAVIRESSVPVFSVRPDSVALEDVDET
ncbi:UspA domain protein (plasmid) [Natronomonas pharaonis DSM 2160]|uniref:UspA domain protein n=1 Tax=Natronomonas pharaonis (strain ATCC 35678 / DSM 2160 / CIP 103997 / JCM 8858 / NBRC 14720 / NCIMB 2260 / Gabara) TaxID=348780 RepID=Q3IM52_NATPD|nr:universal stress protein [Natronomonas pharaonis]CAI50810.1 UspA domain protein [Natronomonas pharaonis DSM 2160]